MILLAALGLVVLASCKKSGSSAPITTANTITGVVDGKTFTCNERFALESYSYMNDTTTWFGFDAYAYDSSNNEFYFEADQAKKVPTPKVYGALGDSTTYAYVEFDSTSGGWWGSETKLNPTTITITSTGGQAVQGTFQGTLYLYGDSTSTNTKVVTNGKFNIPVL